MKSIVTQNIINGFAVTSLAIGRSFEKLPNLARNEQPRRMAGFEIVRIASIHCWYPS